MSNIVKLSKDTLEVLKVMSTINNSLKFEAGSTLKTISAGGSIIMEAEIAETFPQGFSIYEMNRFLNVLNLANMKDAQLEFNDGNKVTIRSGKSKVDYYFSSETFVQHPGKQIQLPTVDLKVTLTEEDIDNFVKGAAALGHKILAFRAVGGAVSLVATTPEVDTSNDMEIGLDLEDGATAPADGTYRIKLENLKVLPGDYVVEICGRGIIRLEHKTRKVITFIGLEKT